MAYPQCKMTKLVFILFVLCLLRFCESHLARNSTLLNDNDRIVGGIRQDISGRNFQVSIAAKSYLCGGSLIRPGWVLTAAHCAKGFSPKDIEVRAGSNYYNKGGETRIVEKVIVHRKYYNKRYYNDIALLKLATPFKLSKNIGLIRLAKRIPKVGGTVIASGYGLLAANGNVAKYLMAAKLKFIDNRRCSKSYNMNIRRSMICAGVRGKDACQGDSGGPLTKGRKLVGVVSWGYGCADPKYPGVYASVPAFRSWILQNIKEVQKEEAPGELC